MAGVLLLALLVVLSLVLGLPGDPRVGLRSRGLGGCGLVAAGIMGLWWCTVRGLWVAPQAWAPSLRFGCWLGLRLLDGCCCGLVVVRGWVWVWVWVCGFQWVVWVRVARTGYQRTGTRTCIVAGTPVLMHTGDPIFAGNQFDPFLTML